MFLPPRDPRVMGGEGREASGWRSLFQIVLVPEQSVIQYALGGGVRGVGASQKRQLVPAANDKSPPLGWETQNYTSDSRGLALPLLPVLVPRCGWEGEDGCLELLPQEQACRNG